MMPLFISYYTVGTGYAKHALGLIETLNQFRLEHLVRGIAPLGAWQDNCQYKTRFIRDVRNAFPGRSVVWVDADARIRRCPSAFEPLDCDLAAVWKDGTEMLTGTMYLAPTAAVDELMERGVRRNYENPTGLYGDQGNFQDVVRESTELRLHRLPPAYAAIFDAGMCRPEEIVIEHLQASRTLAGGL